MSIFESVNETCRNALYPYLSTNQCASQHGSVHVLSPAVYGMQHGRFKIVRKTGRKIMVPVASQPSASPIRAPMTAPAARSIFFFIQIPPVIVATSQPPAGCTVCRDEAERLELTPPAPWNCAPRGSIDALPGRAEPDQAANDQSHDCSGVTDMLCGDRLFHI